MRQGDWTIWGHARVEAQLYFCGAAERQGDPLLVALSSVVRSVWG